MLANEAWLLAVPVAAALGYATRSWLGRRRREEAMRNSEERLKLVLWSTGDELWELDVLRDQFIRTNPLRHLKGSGHEVVKDTLNVLLKYEADIEAAMPQVSTFIAKVSRQNVFG